MRTIRQWTALAVSAVMLAGLQPVYAAQPDTFAAAEKIRQEGTLRDESAKEASGAPELEIKQPESLGEEPPFETEQPESLGEEPLLETEQPESLGEEPPFETEEPEWSDHYLEIVGDDYELAAGETVQLETDTDIPQSELVYQSEDPSVAAVSETGLVTAVSGGANGEQSVRITVSWQNPKNESNRYTASCIVYVENTIELDQTECVIYTGQSAAYRLSAQTNPAGAVRWQSSRPHIVEVDANGILTPKKAGEATITATANGVSAYCYVTVKKPSLAIPKKATIFLKNPAALETEVSPAARVKWSSSNKKIATVSAKGVITGKKTGKVTIKAAANGVTKTCKVTVVKPSIAVSADAYSPENTVGVFKGSSTQLHVNAEAPAAVTWKSSNKKVAKVSRDGVVTAQKAGTATITASIPGAKASYKVKVIKNPYRLNFTDRTIMAGNSATLYVRNLTGSENPYFRQEDYSDVVQLYTDSNACEIEANQAGQTTIHVSFWVWRDNLMVNWSDTCRITVLGSGIRQQQFSLAKGETEKLEIINGEDAGAVQSAVWSSSDPAAASVDPDTGLLTAHRKGSATITAAVTYTDGASRIYTSKMKVSDPQIKSSEVTAALYGNRCIEIEGLNAYSEIKWKSGRPAVAQIAADGRVKGVKKGKTAVTATVDGKPMQFTLYISNPSLPVSYSALSYRETVKISVKGLTSKSKVTYKSLNTQVAAVTKSGTVTAKSGGRAEIAVDADGREFTYLVEVASKTALNARALGKSIIDRSSYSQALRMTEGYYDCSSLVFRAYERNSRLLGGGYSWAPTAAGMAQHMANTGKVIAWKGVPVEQLRPGDLLFYGGENNGRYKGIYHVSMYYGNGDRLEKPLRAYYPAGSIVMVARPAP